MDQLTRQRRYRDAAAETAVFTHPLDARPLRQHVGSCPTLRSVLPAGFRFVGRKPADAARAKKPAGLPPHETGL